MAKTSSTTGPAEPSQPLIISLVFFVLLTIGLGVFCYVLYSDQKGKDDAVAKAAADLKAARAEAKDWENVAKVNQVFAGVADDATRTALLAEVKEGDKAYQEVQSLSKRARDQAAVSAKAAVGRADPKGPKADPKAGGADEFAAIWPAAGGPLGPPATSLIDLAVKSRVDRDLAQKRAAADREGYAAAVKAMADVSAEYQKARKEFEKQTVELPAAFNAKMAELQKQADKRAEVFTSTEAAFRTETEKLQEEKTKLDDQKRRLEGEGSKLRGDLRDLRDKQAPPDQFKADAPQGKITRRLPENVVEIDLGADDRVKEGLVFTVLPADFPQTGRQSRMRVYREPDARGRYQNVERFTPKATLEVTDVIGPHLSRARLTGEADDIRDRVLAGDLLYNAVWRKGDVDHVALVGIFDVNGDGTDDVEAVVRDLQRMGIPVDAVLDLRTLKWRGQLGNRTRFLVEGQLPTSGVSDPNRDAKVKITGAIAAAREDAKNKAIPVVKYQDFFGRMGYRVAPNVTDERINQAATRYLGGVGATEAPKEGN
ncbi:MAG: hypothetical protein K2X87_12525 [Gemmataceae bacterium]|nr:hypothetical protein [Gemmataceae bacterium]